MALRSTARGDDTTASEENRYGRRGSLELGGGVGLSWVSNAFAIQATPAAGLFVRDRIELSTLLAFDYIRTTTPLGQRTSKWTGSLLVEPSYHLPIEDDLQVFGGLGVGAGYDGQHPDFEVIPRAGINIKLGRGAVLSPAASMPIVVGKSHGENGNVGAAVQLIILVGFAAVL